MLIQAMILTLLLFVVISIVSSESNQPCEVIRSKIRPLTRPWPRPKASLTGQKPTDPTPPQDHHQGSTNQIGQKKFETPFEDLLRSPGKARMNGDDMLFAKMKHTSLQSRDAIHYRALYNKCSLLPYLKQELDDNENREWWVRDNYDELGH